MARVPTMTEGWQSGHISVDGKDLRSNTTFMWGGILASTEIRISSEFDSAASDTAGIQEAHDDLPADGGMIYIPHGESLIKDTILITKPVCLRGEDIGGQVYGGSWLKLDDGVDKRMIDINLTAPYNFFPTIVYLGLDGNRVNNTYTEMIRVRAAYNFQMFNCICVQSDVDIIRLVGPGSSHIISSNCLEFSSGVAIKIDTPPGLMASIRIVNNHITSVGYGTWVNNISAPVSIIATGNLFGDLTGNALFCRASLGAEINFSGNTIFQTGLHSVYIDASSKINISSNTLFDLNLNGIFIEGATSEHITINNNHIDALGEGVKGPGNYGVYIEAGDFIGVIGNHIYNAAISKIFCLPAINQNGQIAHNW